MTSTSRAFMNITSRPLPSAFVKNAAIFRADQISPYPETRSRLRFDAARTSASAFRMLSMSARSLSNASMMGFAPAAPSSSTFAFSCLARNAVRVASTDCLFAALSTRPSKSSVTPFIADTTTARLLPGFWPPTMSATRRMQLASATLVPPNLCTVQVMTRYSGEAVFGGREHSRTAGGYEGPSARTRNLSLRDLAAHRGDRGGVIGSPKDRRARDERVGACRRDPADVRDLDAAVDLEPHGQARAVDERADGRDLRQHRLDELLPAEPRVHGHQEHEIDLVEHVIEPVKRRRGIENEPALATAFADQLQSPVDVLGRLGMEADESGTRGGEVGNDAIDRLHHEVHVDRRLDAVLAQRLAHERADREIRHVVVVHYVEVDEIRAGRYDRVHLFAEPREIGR